MTGYIQDDVPRSCSICQQAIQPGQRMLDLFRAASVEPGTQQRVEWVHIACAQKAIETWLCKKREPKTEPVAKPSVAPDVTSKTTFVPKGTKPKPKGKTK